VERYLRHALPRAQVVMLVDSKVGATPLDAQALEYLRSFAAPVAVVATKADRVPRGQRARAMADVRAALGLDREDDVPLAVSARTGEGIGGLWKRIEERL